MEIQNAEILRSMESGISFGVWLRKNKLTLIIAALMIASSFFITPYMMVASAAYFLMLLGMLFRKLNPRFHLWLMATAMLTDMTLVLTLEVTRNAIHTALSFRLNHIQQAHIYVSSGASSLYFPIVILGIMKFTKKQLTPSIRLWHKRLGISAFTLRTLGYCLMFSMLMPHPT